MRLHSIVAGAVGAVNPRLPVGIQISVGSGPTSAAGQRPPAYATPGNITASIGGTFTATANGTTLTVDTVLTGTLQADDVVAGTDGLAVIPPDTTIVQQLTGPPGGAGTYEMSAPVTLNSCMVTSTSDILVVTAIADGILQLGQTLADNPAVLAAGTIITELGTGAGGVGTYFVNKPQTVTGETMTTSVTLLAQVQPVTFRDLQQLESLNLQGTRKSVYINGAIDGEIRIAIKNGDLISLPDGTVWLVVLVLEAFNITSGWTKAAITLQNQ